MAVKTKKEEIGVPIEPGKWDELSRPQMQTSEKDDRLAGVGPSEKTMRKEE